MELMESEWKRKLLQNSKIALFQNGEDQTIAEQNCLESEWNRFRWLQNGIELNYCKMEWSGIESEWKLKEEEYNILQNQAGQNPKEVQDRTIAELN